MDPSKAARAALLVARKRADGGGVPLLPERPDVAQYRAMDPDARDAWKSDRDWRSGNDRVLKPGDPQRDANFKNWFGDSKIVDKTGAPLRTYHISNKNFTRFIPGGSYNEREHESGPATWLSPYPDKQPAAHRVGGYEGKFKDGTNVMPLHVSMKNPLVLDHRAAMDRAKEILGDTHRGQFPLLLEQAQINRLQEAGHDGIIYAGTNAVLRDEPAYQKHALGEHPDHGEEIISFRPQTQLKSAIGNRGRYGRQDNDIRYATGGAVDTDRQAKIDEHNRVLKEARPIGMKGGLTASEARKYDQLMSRAAELKFELAKKATPEKVLPAEETKSALHPDTVVTAHGDLHRAKPIYMAISRAAHGVKFNANTPVDDIMDGHHPDVTPGDLYNNFQGTRDALRKQYGDTMTLYRSEGRQMPKATKNWATTPEFAKLFGGDVISQQVPVDHVVAANVTPNGKYHELIVGKPPTKTFKRGGPVVTPEMIAPAEEAPKIVKAAKAKPVEEPIGEDHPAWIPTRLVTSKKSTSQRGDIVDMKSLRDAPTLYEKNIDVLRSYPNMRESTSKRDHKAVEQEMTRHVKENLLDLHDRVPEEIRNRSKLWYDGARKITDDWTKRYELPDHSVAGALAALSPQKDWYQNVSLAKRVLDATRGDPDFYKGFQFSPDMEDTWRGRPSLAKPVYEGLIGTLRGKSLADVDKLDMSPAERATLKAMWIRMHDETHNDPSHPIVTPEGGFGELVKTAGGENAKVGWGSLGEIAKAVRSIESADNPAALSPLMGERHKVRNFYNNIISPNSRHGDVTIDTHAVAAALMRPLSGNSLEVAHNFANYPGAGLPTAGGSAITGAQGLYPLYADAYRQAAKERGILPREMQSITWEAIRGLFPDTFKTKANGAKVDAVWHQYRKGKLSQSQARDQIHELAGGIRNPTWVTGPDEANQGASNTGALPEPVVHGQSAQGTDPGAGGGLAAAIPQASLVSAKLQKASGGSVFRDPYKHTRKVVSTTGRYANGGAVDHNPSDAQKTAGNYAKRKISFQGIPISIENALGSVRHGRDGNGKAWSCKLPADYGYIRGTNGADGDHLDAYVGPNPHSELCVLVNQCHLGGGFDEHKAMLGFGSEKEAIDCYCKAFSDGKGADRIKSVEVMSVPAFKSWLKSGKTTRPANGRSIVDRALQLTSKGAQA